MTFVIVATFERVSLRGVRLDWRKPLKIWQITDEGQQPLIGEIQRSELRGLPLLLRLVSGSLLIFALPFVGLKRLLPFRLIVFSWLACDHDSLSRCVDIVFQGGISICPFV